MLFRPGKCRRSIPIPNRDIRSPLQQGAHRFRTALTGRFDQRGLSHVILGVHLRALFEQHRHGIRVARVGRMNQRRIVILILGIHVRALLEQGAHGVRTARKGGPKQRRPSRIVLGIDLRTLLQQGAHGFRVALQRRLHQCRPPGVTFGIDLRTLLQQGAHGFRMASDRCAHQRRVSITTLGIGVRALPKEALYFGSIPGLGRIQQLFIEVLTARGGWRGWLRFGSCRGAGGGRRGAWHARGSVLYTCFRRHGRSAPKQGNNARILVLFRQPKGRVSLLILRIHIRSLLQQGAHGV